MGLWPEEGPPALLAQLRELALKRLKLTEADVQDLISQRAQVRACRGETTIVCAPATALRTSVRTVGAGCVWEQGFKPACREIPFRNSMTAASFPPPEIDFWSVGYGVSLFWLFSSPVHDKSPSLHVQPIAWLHLQVPQALCTIPEHSCTHTDPV